MQQQNNNKTDFFIEQITETFTCSISYTRTVRRAAQQFPSPEQETKDAAVKEASHILVLPEDVGDNKHLRNIDGDKDKQEHED